MIKKILIVSFSLLVIGFCLLIYVGNINEPKLNQPSLTKEEIQKNSSFHNKKKWGVHQVVLKGSPFERGQQFGFWTQQYIAKQEQSMVKKLKEIIPYSIFRYALFLFSMGWFQGLDEHLHENWKQEMYGVSLYAPQENLFFATPYTRQVAYHGVHDMGQMMVDHGLVLGACTQIATPLNSGWIVGRNFDFEAGRVFDEDKVIKWVFPEKGNAFVSVVFSGMVGVITGINQHGVYVAINAAGSDDFTRIGTPTTLIVLNALQNANSAKEAVEIIKNSESLITDIFVVTDKSDFLFIVEKTPKRIAVRVATDKTAITNHLIHDTFKNDSKNLDRIKNNTTLQRLTKANFLLSAQTNSFDHNDILAILRDKVSINNRPVLNHRSSIDALIASHAVVYNSQNMRLYVSKGPSLSKEFVGIDLRKSFSQQSPVMIQNLPEDRDLKKIDFYQVKDVINAFDKARKLAQQGSCQQAHNLLTNQPKENLINHYRLYWAQAETSLCEGKVTQAKPLYQKALDLKPAYKQERDYLNEKINTL